MDIARRPLLTEPGEMLLVPQAPLSAAARWSTFQASFGLEPEEMVISSLVTLPLPLYPSEWPAGRRRWLGTRPEAMWHPLMWLPQRVAGRAILERDPATGETTVLESRDMWAVRVMMELSFAGLYDTETGAWIDVLSMHGLDIAEAETQSRVARWLDGDADPFLDSIDLSSNLDVPDDLWWAVDTAADMADALWVVSWATAADELHSVIDDVIEKTAEGSLDDPSEVRGVLSLVCGVARTSFLYVPAAGEDTPDGDSEEDFWSGAAIRAGELDYADYESVGGFIETVSARLHALRDVYWPEVERFAREAMRVEASLQAEQAESREGAQGHFADVGPVGA